MTKRQASVFFFVTTGVFLVTFGALTIQTHTRFPALTHADRITPAVVAGEAVWHRKNCVNCHTLLGEGAYYAPDLTGITAQRGDTYLTAFLQQPSRFYDEEQTGRVMPTLGLSDARIADLLAFLHWVNGIQNEGWPPRPILVSGSAVPGAARAGPPGPAASADPVAQGETLFNSTPPGCSSCHSVSPGVSLVGPSLAGIATTAARRIRSPDYTGSADSAAGYIRESIVRPNAFIVPGATYASAGRSIMPADFGETLTTGQVDHLVAYLMTLR